jgi:hypothetical protein
MTETTTVKPQYDFETNFMNILNTWDESKINDWVSKIPNELNNLVSVIRKRVSKEWEKDCVIVITSPEQGNGKSSLAVIIGWLLDPEHFDLIQNISYIGDPREVKEKFFKIKSENAIIADEALSSLHKWSWQSSFQQDLVKLIQTERWQRKVVILCIPRIVDLAENVRSHSTHIWIKVLRRGHAVVHVKRDIDESLDAWYLNEGIKYKDKFWRGKHLAEIPFNEVLKSERAKRTYLFDFEFPALPQPVEKVYKKLKAEEHLKRDESEEVTETKPEREWKERFFRAIKVIKGLNPKITKTKIFKELGIGKETLVKLLQEFDPKDDLFRIKTPEELVAEGVIPAFMINTEEKEQS